MTAYRDALLDALHRAKNQMLEIAQKLLEEKPK